MPTVIKFTPPSDKNDDSDCPESPTSDLPSASPDSDPSSRCHIKLKIERGGVSENKYIYKYSVSEMVMSKEIKFIDFELFDTSQLKVYEVFMHGYVSSRHGAFQPVETAVDDNPSIYISSKSSKCHFEKNTTYVKFRPALEDLELAHIGLIIAIRETPKADYEYILCDPQVGNGPPPGGGKSNIPLENKLQFDPSLKTFNKYFGFNLN